MKKRQEVIDVLRRERARLEREFGVERMALFGSYAREEQRPDSDIDVMVWVEPSLGLRFVDLADEIESLLGVPCDVVSRRAVSPRHWRLIEPELVNVA